MSLRFGYGTNGFTSQRVHNHRLDDALAVIADLGYVGVALTLELLALTGTPVARLNRVVAVGEADVPRRAAVAAYLHERAGDLKQAAELYAEASHADSTDHVGTSLADPKPKVFHEQAYNSRFVVLRVGWTSRPRLHRCRCRAPYVRRVRAHRFGGRVLLGAGQSRPTQAGPKARSKGCRFGTFGPCRPGLPGVTVSHDTDDRTRASRCEPDPGVPAG